MSKKQLQSSCDTCLYYTYDEDYESYMCDMDMDEDEYVRLITDSHYHCPVSYTHLTLPTKLLV